MAAFFGLTGLAWYFKPVAGLLADAVPLWGSRRRNYLILSGLGAGLLWALLGLAPRQLAARLAARCGGHVLFASDERRQPGHNLKQIGMALTQYSQDSDEAMVNHYYGTWMGRPDLPGGGLPRPALPVDGRHPAVRQERADL